MPKGSWESLDEVTGRTSATRSDYWAGVHWCILFQPPPCPTQKKLPWKPRSDLVPILSQAMQGTQPSGGSFGLRSRHAIDQLHHGLVANFEVIDLEFHASDATFNCPNKPNITPSTKIQALVLVPAANVVSLFCLLPSCNTGLFLAAFLNSSEHLARLPIPMFLQPDQISGGLGWHHMQMYVRGTPLSLDLASLVRANHLRSVDVSTAVSQLNLVLVYSGKKIVRCHVEQRGFFVLATGRTLNVCLATSLMGKTCICNACSSCGMIAGLKQVHSKLIWRKDRYKVPAAHSWNFWLSISSLRLTATTDPRHQSNSINFPSVQLLLRLPQSCIELTSPQHHALPQLTFTPHRPLLLVSHFSILRRLRA